MRNYILVILVLLSSCFEKEPVIKEYLPEVNLSTAYPSSDTEVDISGNLLANELKENVEYGIVWADNSSPTLNNQKNTIGKINVGIHFNAKIKDLIPGSKIYVRAFVKNNLDEINYSNIIEVKVQKSKNWRKMGDLKIEEGQFTGIPIKLDGNNLTFIRLNEYNEWEQFKHYNGAWYDPNFTWEKEKYRFPQFSPRQDPLFFTLNLSKDYTRPAAFLGGGFAVSPQIPNSKIYLKDMYWVYDNQNYLEPIPIGDGPIAHFTLNRNEYLLEENNTDNFWSYFSLEQFIKLKPFPQIGSGYDYLGVSTDSRGYIFAQKFDEKEVLLFEYSDITKEWTQKMKFPGEGRLDGVCFSFKNKIYYGLGRNTNPVKGLTDIWEFDPSLNTWTFVTNYPGAGNIKVMASDLGEYAVLFCGYQVRASGAGTEKYYNANDTWMFLGNK